MWRQSVTTGWGWQLKRAWFSFNFSFHTICSLQLFPRGLSTRRKSVGKMKKKNREIKKRIKIIWLICNKVVFLCLCHLNGLPNNLSCNWIFTTWIWISQQLFSKKHHIFCSFYSTNIALKCNKYWMRLSMISWIIKTEVTTTTTFILPSKITSTNTIINNISKYLEGTGTWNNHRAN